MPGNRPFCPVFYAFEGVFHPIIPLFPSVLFPVLVKIVVKLRRLTAFYLLLFTPQTSKSIATTGFLVARVIRNNSHSNFRHVVTELGALNCSNLYTPTTRMNCKEKTKTAEIAAFLCRCLLIFVGKCAIIDFSDKKH